MQSYLTVFIRDSYRQLSILCLTCTAHLDAHAHSRALASGTDALLVLYCKDITVETPGTFGSKEKVIEARLSTYGCGVVRSRAARSALCRTQAAAFPVHVKRNPTRLCGTEEGQQATERV